MYSPFEENDENEVVPPTPWKATGGQSKPAVPTPVATSQVTPQPTVSFSPQRLPTQQATYDWYQSGYPPTFSHSVANPAQSKPLAQPTPSQSPSSQAQGQAQSNFTPNYYSYYPNYFPPTQQNAFPNYPAGTWNSTTSTYSTTNTDTTASTNTPAATTPQWYTYSNQYTAPQKPMNTQVPQYISVGTGVRTPVSFQINAKTNPQPTTTPNILPSTPKITKPKPETPKTNATQTVPGTPGGKNTDWPPNLRAFVERAFEVCPDEAQQAATEISLKKIINQAIANQTLWTKDWDSEPIPTVSVEKIENKDKQETPGVIRFGQNAKWKGQNKQQQTAKDKMAEVPVSAEDKKTKRKKEFMINAEGMTPATERQEEEKRQRRAKRFQSNNRTTNKQHTNENSTSTYTFNCTIPTMVEEINWDALIIKGTSQALEKQYLRLTSAPDPSTVRPEEVLKKSLNHLKSKWKVSPDYAYTCEQLKSIRQDLTVQCIKNRFSVEVYETHARLALENGDFSEFNQCQTQLKELYKEGFAGNVKEFIAYRILYNLFSESNSELLKIMRELDPKSRSHPEIHHALEVRAAMAQMNYHQFFILYKKVPNMGVFLMDLFVDRVRICALRAISQSYRPSIPIPFLQKELGFNSWSECVEFLQEHNATFCDVSNPLELQKQNLNPKLSLDTKNSLNAFLSASIRNSEPLNPNANI